ncbi:hypothetical protein EYR40_000263 [Pleurotus pulmonarius]|nr:hypothetical protein EYR36_001376 [Pleurotus pulmonarius]KAF4607927.1 hypothetical protein EYR40_000263 [Pleurotus pulmonarius]
MQSNRTSQVSSFHKEHLLIRNYSIEPTVLARGQYFYGKQNLPHRYYIENDKSRIPSNLPITVMLCLTENDPNGNHWYSFLQVRTSVIAEYSPLIHRNLTEALRERVPTGYRKDLIPTIKLNVPSIELFTLFYEFMVTKDDHEMMRTLLSREGAHGIWRFQNMPVWLYIMVEDFLHVPTTPAAAPLWLVYTQLRRQLKCPNRNTTSWA